MHLNKHFGIRNFQLYFFAVNEECDESDACKKNQFQLRLLTNPN